MTAEHPVKLVLFLVASAGLAYLSRASLLAPRRHGFYRFLAWECILALVLLNARRWFQDPFSPAQLVSWLLLLVSGFLVLHGVYLLRRFGRQDRARGDASLVGIERTTRLVTEGAYRYIRHPLYSSLLFLAGGIFCKNPGWMAGVLATAATASLVATARIEEAENIRFFGPPYRQYMTRTRMFIPFVF